MKVRTIIGSSAYAVIQTDTINLDIQLQPGRSAAQSLRETAAEWRAKAQKMIERAELAEQAANLI